uniref:Tektin n=1 Tax=Zosterops lateralis melanops TaxID=1220523 RepID=A0A8D2P9E7_ZOSLA
MLSEGIQTQEIQGLCGCPGQDCSQHKLGVVVRGTTRAPRPPPPKVLPATSTMAGNCYKSRMPYHPESFSMPWMPNSYYKAAALNPTLSPLTESFPGLPPTKMVPFISERPNGAFSRHTLDDWHRSNMTNYKESETTRHNAERLRADLNRAIKDVYQQGKRSQGESTQNLGERVNDIEYWKSELCIELDAMIRETNSLADMQKRPVPAASADVTTCPHQVAHKCLLNREKRMGIDLVSDDVEKQLIEVSLRLQQCNKEARQELEKDLADKQLGHHIDSKCYQMKNTSRGLHFFKGVERIDATVSVPETWARFTDNNIFRSQSARAASAKLRASTESLLMGTADEMWRQFSKVNDAFTSRITEIANAKSKIQTHLAKTRQEIFQIETKIQVIQKTIRDKEAQLKVAQTRLDERTRRPNVELCRDAAQLRLVQEVNEINETLRNLHQCLRASEDMLQMLVRSKGVLEHDLVVKNNSLFIDQERCMGMRKSYPSTVQILGYVSDASFPFVFSLSLRARKELKISCMSPNPPTGIHPCPPSLCFQEKNCRIFLLLSVCDVEEAQGEVKPLVRIMSC